MPRPLLVLNLSGGVIRQAFCALPGMQVLVVDWDIASAVPGEPGLVNVMVGHSCELACVTELAVDPLSQLAGSDTEAAIDAAYEQGVLCDEHELEASQAAA